MATKDETTSRAMASTSDETSVTNTMEETIHKSSSGDDDRSGKPFYGDLVRAVAFTVIVPVSAYDVKKTGACHGESDMCQTALFTVLLVALTCAVNWASYLKHSNTISMVGFLLAMWVCAYINLMQWPYAGECVITNMFQGVLIGNLCNGALTFRNHLIRMAIMFGVASYVSIQSPFSVYEEDVLPLLGGPILLVTLFLAATRLDWRTLLFGNSMANANAATNWNQISVQGSRWVLSIVYMHHVSSELLSMTFEEGITAREIFRTLVKAGILASVGVMATGSFQQEIDTNAQLEKLVQSRTRIIREKNDRLHMVELALEASETAIAITDAQTKIIWRNPACHAISTETAKYVEESPNDLGKPITEVLALETIMDEKKLAQAFSTSRKEDEICIHGRIFRLEVSPYEYTSSSDSKNSSKSDSGRFLVVLKNITAERAREVAEKTAQEEAMLAKAMGDSMLTLTHELRTPMQGIMGVTGMLLQQKQYADSVLVESLRLIMASSGLLLNLINNLLDVKKVNSEMMDEFPLSPVTATDAIQDSINFCQPLASISGVAVVTDYGEDRKNDYQVVSNSLRLQQVLINLVSNAIKYTSEHSQIRISIQPSVMADVELKMKLALASSRDGNAKHVENRPVKEPIPSNAPVLCFSISDCGPGIAPHQANRLFRRFARLDSKPTRVLGGSNKVGQPSGTGLGLNLCQLFLQRMNGEIWAANNSEGSGSTFSFFLPLAVAESNNDLRISAPVSLKKRCRSFEDLDITTPQLRVLLVDDVLINRKVIGRMVKQVGVLDIVTADSGESALIELSENGPYDLVITDLQMPGMSGMDLCQAIMSGNACPSNRIPVVVGLTADTSVNVAENCRASGMSNVLYKPISVVEMKDFFETSVMRLRPGVWYTGRGNSTVLSAQ